MSYKIPDKKLVYYFAKKAIKKLGMINSQTLFLKLVLKDLREGDANYTITYKRFRKIILGKKGVNLKIHYRETDKEIDASTKCPVCGSSLKKIVNKTLDGKIVTIGYRCARCPYWSGMKKRVPFRYVFSR